MATPYNLRARKRDDRSVQKSVKTPQSKRKRATATKVVKKDESDHEKDQQDQAPETELLSLTTDEPKKRLTWEEEEEEKEDLPDRSAGSDGEGVESDDSEAGPDDVSLSVAKQQAKQQLHQQQIESENKRKTLKEKRRKKHALYQQQKEMKRQQMSLERFDEEELKIVAATLSAGEVVDKSAGDDPPKAKKLKRKQKRTGSRPVVEQRRVGGVQVVAIATGSSGTQPCAAAFDTAKAFLHNRLYGNHSRRAPALTLHAKKYHSQPARNFHRTT